MTENPKRVLPDAPAQITVALIEFVQTALAVATRSYWRVLPNPLPLKRNDVVTVLARMPKPIRVAPLAQPGALGTWPYTPASDLERTLFEQRAQNLEKRVREILAPFVTDGEPVQVLLEHEGGEGVFSSDDVEQWCRDYVMDGVGWILVDSGGDPRAPVRFVLARPDGTWFPALPRRPFGEAALAVLEVAEVEAGRFHQDVAGTEHVLLAMARSTDPVIRRAFDALPLGYDAIDGAVTRLARKSPAAGAPRVGARTSRLRHALEAAARVSEREQAPQVDNPHLLEALLLDAVVPTTMIAEILKACGQTPQSVSSRLREARSA